MAAQLLGTDIARNNTVCSDQTGSTPYKLKVNVQHSLYSVLLQHIIECIVGSELIHVVSRNHNSESLLLYNSVTLILKVETSWRQHVDTGHITLTLSWRQPIDTDHVTLTLKWRQHVDNGPVTLTVELERAY